MRIETKFYIDHYEFDTTQLTELCDFMMRLGFTTGVAPADNIRPYSQFNNAGTEKSARGNTQYQSEEKQYRCNNAGHSHRPRGCGFSDKAIQDIIFVPLSELKRDRSLDRIQIRATLWIDTPKSDTERWNNIQQWAVIWFNHNQSVRHDRLLQL